jgi:hypothetical protein
MITRQTKLPQSIILHEDAVIFNFFFSYFLECLPIPVFLWTLVLGKWLKTLVTSAILSKFCCPNLKRVIFILSSVLISQKE